MSVFSYHLVKTSYLSSLQATVSAPKVGNIKGLIHAEGMNAMTLGAPVFSLSRILIRQVALFAQWENETAIDHFLEEDRVGRIMAKGWHTRLVFMRQWGGIRGFKIPAATIATDTPDDPVVAVTIARMKFQEIPRFIHWGRPVEQLVRDHPGTTLSLASIKFPNMVSTFSVWKKQRDMTDMVLGHAAMPRPGRHINAMKERDRKDFHFEFTTLRFKPVAEFGEWKGRTDIIPGLKNNN